MHYVARSVSTRQAASSISATPSSLPMPAFNRPLKGSAAVLCAIVLLGPALSLAGDTAESPSLPAHLGMADALRLFRERGFDLIVADATVDSVRGDAQMA